MAIDAATAEEMAAADWKRSASCGFNRVYGGVKRMHSGEDIAVAQRAIERQ